MPTIPPDALADVVAGIFHAAGASERIARIVAESLVLSDMVGHESHGVVRVRQYLASIRAGDIVPHAEPVVVRETAVLSLVDARRGFGQLAARLAMEQAIAKARTQGLAASGVYHSNHLGRIGEWVTGVAEAGLVGLAFCSLGQRGASVAPHGGAARLLGTNPFAAAVPVDGRPPLLVDFATSTVAEGKLRVARNRGQAIPAGWVVTAEGHPTTDPADFYAGGALLPAAGHKGYGLGMLVELLGGLLTDGGDPQRPTAHSGHGLLLIALAPGLFRPAEAFLADAAALCARAAAVPPAAGFAEVLIPGDPEHRTRAARAAAVPVDDTTWSMLAETAAELGIVLPHA